MSVLIGAIAAIAGAIVQWGLSEITKMINNRQKASQDLKTAAFVCLDRLLKIQNAEIHSNNIQKNHEIYLLGGDLDRYRDCIAASPPKMRERHWSIYRQMLPILLQHDLSRLNYVITELEIICGARDESSSTNTV
jgi:hypothetical protein